MAHDDLVYLRHILDAINIVEEYLHEVKEDQFNRTRLLQDGVIRQIEIVGEAVRHISQDIRRTYPEIPWQDVAGMRDKLIHDYFGVDFEMIWKVVKTELLPIREKLVQMKTGLGNYSVERHSHIGKMKVKDIVKDME